MSLLSNIISGSSALILGFSIGTAFDLLFFTLYKKIDPNQKNIIKLILITMVQVICLITTLHFSYMYLEDNIAKTVFNTGLISSQIFMMNYTINRLGNLIYARNLGLPPPKPVTSVFRIG